MITYKTATTGLAIVTGASAGLGIEFAKLLQVRGYYLLLVARRRDRLESVLNSLGGSEAGSILVADLSTQAGRDSLISATLKLNQSYPLKVLINNAGFGLVGRTLEMDASKLTQMVELNCIAPLDLSRQLAPMMDKNGGGHILNVCSTAAFQPLPYMACYAATKSFLKSFSRALSVELAGYNISVLAHCPGPTKTEFHIAAGLEEKIDFLSSVPASGVAREAIEALFANKKLLINGLRNRFLATLAGLLPENIVLLIGKLTLGQYVKKTSG
ncbi:SDR family NAD(P)-dependent oxidoreductase [bacterium]|nr:SDR family NAD(P)-dependent oxidoreductase [bacterium]